MYGLCQPVVGSHHRRFRRPSTIEPWLRKEARTRRFIRNRRAVFDVCHQRQTEQHRVQIFRLQEFRNRRKQVYIMQGEWLCSQTSPCNELFVHREDDDRVRKKMVIVVVLRARSAQVPVVLTNGVSFQRPANKSGAIRWLVQAQWHESKCRHRCKRHTAPRSHIQVHRTGRVMFQLMRVGGVRIGQIIHSPCGK